jgi:hypothetical protein
VVKQQQNFSQIMADMDINVLALKHNAIDIIANVFVLVFIA